MKRKLKQWWSTILLISTKQTITSHINSLNTKKTMTYDVGYPGSGLGQAQKYGRVKPVKWDPNIPSFGNWISNGNTDINNDKKPA